MVRMGAYESLGELLRRHAGGSCAGRAGELAVLSRQLDDGGTPLLFLYGLSGIGKSALLRDYAVLAAGKGYHLALLDAEAIEPSEPGFMAALEGAAGIGAGRPAWDVLAGRTAPTLILIDHYEHIALLDGWLRQSLLPQLPANVKVLVAGRHPPGSGWLLCPGWSGLVASIELGPLTQAAAMGWLADSGVPQHESQRLARLTHGHPLALRLAIGAWRANPGTGLPEGQLNQVIEALVASCMDGIDDPDVHEALRRTSLLRRISLPLLAQLVPAADNTALFDKLARLPIISRGPDGLTMQALVRNAVAQAYRASDPDGVARVKALAAQCIRTQAAAAARQDWAYSADLLYLLEHPAIRAIYFGDGSTTHEVEQARAADGAAIVALAARQGGPVQAAEAARWWELAPHCFHVARTPATPVAGFYVVATSDQIPAQLMAEDEVVRGTLRHLDGHPLAAGDAWILLRMRFCAQAGSSISEANAAMCLDVKRCYIHHRLRLRRMYGPLEIRSDYVEPFRHVGMAPLPGYEHVVDGHAQHLLMLDVGPDRLNGWLAGLLAAEATAGGVPALSLDDVSRQLIVEGRNVALSPLEFKLMRHLFVHRGEALSRDSLLQKVWGAHYETGSNVVDVAIRALRRKLGAQATLIETVPRFGYRFRPS